MKDPSTADIDTVMERIDEAERRLLEAQDEIAHLRFRLAKAERDAITDSLTGIANRRGYMELFTNLARQADAAHRPLSVLMVDVDHFKEFNDRFGHDVGDHVLRLVANALAELPANDPDSPSLLGRYGGEEFAVTLQAVGAHRALELAEGLRQQLEGRRFVMRGSGQVLGTITMSIGVAERARGELPSDAIRRADIALYRAKRRGRNRVEFAALDPDSQEPSAALDPRLGSIKVWE